MFIQKVIKKSLHYKAWKLEKTSQSPSNTLVPASHCVPEPKGGWGGQSLLIKMPSCILFSKKSFCLPPVPIPVPQNCAFLTVLYHLALCQVLWCQLAHCPSASQLFLGNLREGIWSQIHMSSNAGSAASWLCRNEKSTISPSGSHFPPKIPWIVRGTVVVIHWKSPKTAFSLIPAF